MKITEVNCHLLTVDLEEHAFSWSGGAVRFWTTALAEIVTDEGIRGVGECYQGLSSPEPTKALTEQFANLLIGEDPFQISLLHYQMKTKALYWAKAGLPLAVIGMLECALWDIFGQAVNLPAWQLFGGKAFDELPAYASGGLDGDESHLTKEYEDYLTKGYTAVKIRIGHSLEEDIAKIRLARQVLGDQTALMVDSVMGHNSRPWSGKEALRRARAFEEYNLTWFEEPCGNKDYEGYALVRANTTIPIAGGESATGVHEFRRFLDANALDYVQPDPAHTGGMLECREVAALAKSRGLKVAYHSWGAAPCVLANFHLAFCDPCATWLEFPTFGHPLVDEVAVEPFELRNGCFRAPSAPGLGVRLTKEVIEKYPYQPGVHAWKK